MRSRRVTSRQDRLASIIKATSSVLEGLGVPRYSSEFSNRLYDVHLKIGWLIIRQHLDVSFRELCSILPSLRVCRGRIPNHSTLVKFSQGADAKSMDKVLQALAHMLC